MVNLCGKRSGNKTIIMSHTWKFFRAGGFNQVVIGSGADLMNLDQLDQKLWVALACPTTGVEFDKTTLALIDTDKDGRVRAPELIAAVKWAGGLLKNPDDLLKGSATLRPAAINDATPEGKLIANFARQVLGKADDGEVTFEEAAAAAATFAAKPFNGDGIVPADSAADDATKAVIADLINCLGAVTDASGKPGVNQAKVDQFFAEAAAYSDWWKKAEGDATVLPLGVNTEAAAGAVKAVKAKVEDYFARGRLAAFDPRAVNALNRDEKEYAALGAKDLTSTHADIAGLPLAQVGATTPLPLTQGLNPAWAGAMAALQTQAITPLLGAKTVLTEADWNALTGKLAAFDAWNAGKTGGTVEKIGLPRAREILATKAKETLTALIARDKAEEGNATAVIGLHRLIHYHRDLAKLCRNFVNFGDFYGRKEKAIFQAGTLYLDQRSCELCLSVDDAGRHAAMAGMAGTYLAYCDCARKGSGEKLSIVAAFTGGDADNLLVGRNGIFYDRAGRDWDATITKIVENPISVRQAFWSPYKKLVRMIEERAAKQAAAADADVSAQLTAAANTPVAPAGRRRGAAVQTGVRSERRCADQPGLGQFGGRLCRHTGFPWKIRTVAGSAGHCRHHARDFRAVHGHRVAEIAQAQSRPDSRRQRLGGERQSQDERAVWRRAYRRGCVAAGRHLRRGGRICGEASGLAQTAGCGVCRLVPLGLPQRQPGPPLALDARGTWQGSGRGAKSPRCSGTR